MKNKTTNNSIIELHEAYELFRAAPFELQYAMSLKRLMESKERIESGDRTGVGTTKLPSQYYILDPVADFPILRGKHMGFRTALTEIIWILLGRNDLAFLKKYGVNYWDAWVKEDGTFGPIYGTLMRDFNGVDQFKNALKDVMFNKDSRRIIMSLWKPDVIEDQSLPCCFVPGKNHVRTEDGTYKLIENLLIGDKVLGDDSNYHSVYDFMETPYKGEIISIKHKLNTYGIDATPNHPFLVKGKGYVNAEELVVGDFIGITNNYAQEITEHKITYENNTAHGNKKSYDFKINNKDQYYFLGYYLGNGFLMEKTNRYVISIPDKKRTEILSKINKCINLGISNNSGINVKTFEGRNKKWSIILKDFGYKSTGKKIPDWIINSHPDLIKAFLAGYMDADGIEDKNKMNSTTVSPHIAYGIQSLCAKINIPCKIHFHPKPPKTVILGRTVNQNNVYSIYIYKNEQLYVDFNENEKIKWSQIKSLDSYHYEGNVYNISVKDNHTYTVNNIINHNCHCFYQYTVNGDTLNMHVTQRSADVFLGVPYDAVLFSVKLIISSLLTGKNIGRVYWGCNDFHRYNNHTDQIQQYLNNVIIDPLNKLDFNKPNPIKAELKELPKLNEDFSNLEEILLSLVEDKSLFKLHNYTEEYSYKEKIKADVAV